MVKTTETDIVSPTITTEDPYRFLSKVILLSKYFWSCWASICCCLFKFCNKSFCSWCVCLSIILCLKVLSCCCLKARLLPYQMQPFLRSLAIAWSRRTFCPRYIPKPCSALSSNNELAHAGPF